MQASIFSKLPNNLIIKIIKMNTEQEQIEEQRENFQYVMMELDYHINGKNCDWFGEYHSESESESESESD